MRKLVSTLILAVLFAFVRGASADEPIRLREAFPADYQYHVSVRVEIEGSLTVPDPKQNPAKPLRVTGHSAIEYDERVLTPGKDGTVDRTARQYRRVDFQRTVGDQPQSSTLRADVRRLIILRHQQKEVPFSPDGPLTWAEIDLIRTDVFTPSLRGLLPEGAVRVGAKWNGSESAIRELTDLEKIDDGGLECRLDQLTNVNGRRYARVSFTGTVRGVNEDGPNRQRLDGYLLFDLESAHVSYLSLKGTSTLLDKAGKTLGEVTGRFVLTRQAHVRSRELADDALRGLALEPNDDNTLLLYDNPDLGVRFLHPRSWRVTGVRGAQVALDETRGSGLLLTVEPAARVPSGAQFLAESRAYLQKHTARIISADSPRTLQAAPRQLEQFALDVEVSGQRVLMDYYVARQAGGGATVAARLLEADRAKLRAEVERIARSIIANGRR